MTPSQRKALQLLVGARKAKHASDIELIRASSVIVHDLQVIYTDKVHEGAARHRLISILVKQLGYDKLDFSEMNSREIKSFIRHDLTDENRTKVEHLL